MRTMKNYLFTLLLFIVSITLLFTTTAPLLNTQSISIKLTNVSAGEIYVVSGNQKMEYETKAINGETIYNLTGEYTDIKNLSKLKYGDLLFFRKTNSIIRELPVIECKDFDTIYIDDIDCIYLVQGLQKVNSNTYRVIDKVVIEKTLAE